MSIYRDSDYNSIFKSEISHMDYGSKIYPKSIGKSGILTYSIPQNFEQYKNSQFEYIDSLNKFYLNKKKGYREHSNESLYVGKPIQGTFSDRIVVKSPDRRQYSSSKKDYESEASDNSTASSGLRYFRYEPLTDSQAAKVQRELWNMKGINEREDRINLEMIILKSSLIPYEEDTSNLYKRILKNLEQARKEKKKQSQKSPVKLYKNLKRTLTLSPTKTKKK